MLLDILNIRVKKLNQIEVTENKNKT